MDTKAFSYLTLTQQSRAEFKDRGSQFLAYAFPVEQKEEFKKQLKKIVQEHPKASHHCYAYCIGFAPHIESKSTDDKEPSGTAGKPILNQLLSKQLTNAAIVVVRYFGGTLLGTAGLANAYKNAASLALQVAYITEKQKKELLLIECEYADVNAILNCLKKYDCTIVEQDLGLFCTIKTRVPLIDLTAVQQRINEIKLDKSDHSF